MGLMNSSEKLFSKFLIFIILLLYKEVVITRTVFCIFPWISWQYSCDKIKCLVNYTTWPKWLLYEQSILGTVEEMQKKMWEIILSMTSRSWQSNFYPNTLYKNVLIVPLQKLEKYVIQKLTELYFLGKNTANE